MASSMTTQDAVATAAAVTDSVADADADQADAAAKAGPVINDNLSVFLKNVDFNTTTDNLQEHFQACGEINRITILCDKWTGRPKGMAYIEFKNQEALSHALQLNDSEFRGRQISVTQKRTNIRGFNRGRGRGRRGRG